MRHYFRSSFDTYAAGCTGVQSSVAGPVGLPLELSQPPVPLIAPLDQYGARSDAQRSRRSLGLVAQDEIGPGRWKSSQFFSQLYQAAKLGSMTSSYLCTFSLGQRQSRSWALTMYGTSDHFDALASGLAGLRLRLNTFCTLRWNRTAPSSGGVPRYRGGGGWYGWLGFPLPVLPFPVPLSLGFVSFPITFAIIAAGGENKWWEAKKNKNHLELGECTTHSLPACWR